MEIKKRSVTVTDSQNKQDPFWQAFGFYLRRQISMGRGVIIPHFGVFTFSAPEVNLKGVTNPEERDKQFRNPVFLISKDFANGIHLKSGMYINDHLIAYKVQSSGKILQTKVNWSEIAQYCQSNKDQAQFQVGKYLRMISDRCINGQNVDIEIPQIGKLRIKNNIAAVQFHDHLIQQSIGITKRPLSERQKQGDIKLLQTQQTVRDNTSQRPNTCYSGNRLQNKTLSSVTVQGFSNSLSDYRQTGENALDKLRNFLSTATKSLRQEFQKLDTYNTGYLTNHQFRQAIRNMQFALKGSEIDELQQCCAPEGNIDYNFFLNMIRFREPEKEYLDNNLRHIENISSLIYTYMLSPKEAFRIFDKSGLGKLKFQEFKVLLLQLTYLANESEYSHQTILKIFKFIDKNNNEYIDLQEWMANFGQFNYQPPASVPKQPKKQNPFQQHEKIHITPVTAYLKQRPVSPAKEAGIKKHVTNYVVRRVNFNNSYHQPYILRQPISKDYDAKNTFSQTVGDYEASKDFDKVIFEIGRNRKFLLQRFEDISNKGKLDFDTTKQVIESMLRNIGIYVKEDIWQMLIKFAEKEGIVDFKFLLESYRDRKGRIDHNPIRSNLFD